MTRPMLIVAIIVALASLATCTVVMNPGPYGFSVSVPQEDRR